MNIDFADIVDGSGWPVTVVVVGFVIFAIIKYWLMPKGYVDQLLRGKDDLLALKDGQIALLTAEKEKLETTVDAQTAQITGLVEATGAFKHFFQEVPVVPSKGDTETRIEA